MAPPLQALRARSQGILGNLGLGQHCNPAKSGYAQKSLQIFILLMWLFDCFIVQIIIYSVLIQVFIVIQFLMNNEVFRENKDCEAVQAAQASHYLFIVWVIFTKECMLLLSILLVNDSISACYNSLDNTIRMKNTCENQYPYNPSKQSSTICLFP